MILKSKVYEAATYIDIQLKKRINYKNTLSEALLPFQIEYDLSEEIKIIFKEDMAQSKDGSLVLAKRVKKKNFFSFAKYEELNAISFIALRNKKNKIKKFINRRYIEKKINFLLMAEETAINKKEKEFLYHISLDKSICEETVFYPRVPLDRIRTEDCKTKRICVSKTIEGCFTAVPFFIYDLFEGDCGTSTEVMVAIFDKEEIKKKNFIDSSELYKKDKVRDANITEECWIVNQKIKPCEVKTIILNKKGIVTELSGIYSYKELKAGRTEDENYWPPMATVVTKTEWREKKMKNKEIYICCSDEVFEEVVLKNNWKHAELIDVKDEDALKIDFRRIIIYKEEQYKQVFKTRDKHLLQKIDIRKIEKTEQKKEKLVCPHCGNEIIISNNKDDIYENLFDGGRKDTEQCPECCSIIHFIEKTVIQYEVTEVERITVNI